MVYPPSAPSPRIRQYPHAHPQHEEDEQLLEDERRKETTINMGGQAGVGSGRASRDEVREGAKGKEAQKEEEPASRGMVIFSVLFYLVAAIVMVMANKWVLNAVSVPLFFLFAQLAIAVILLHISAFFGYFKIPKIEFEVCRGLAPLISINVLGLGLNTFTLQYVDASFYQVARGLVLPFTVIFSYFLLHTRSSTVTYLAVVVVCLGFFLGVSAEHMTVSRLGVFFGVASSVTTAVHAIVVKRSLGVVKGSTMDLVYYSNFLSAIVLGPTVVLTGEIGKVVEMWNVGGDAFKTFCTGTAIAGIFGFLICIAGFLSIKVTSPVTHMVSSAVRGVLQTFLGMWLFGDIITTGRATGISFILGGSIWYTWIKDREGRAAAEAKAASAAASSSSHATSSSSPHTNQHQHQNGSATSPVVASGAHFGKSDGHYKRASRGFTGDAGSGVGVGGSGSDGIEKGLGNGDAEQGLGLDEKAALRERERVY